MNIHYGEIEMLETNRLIIRKPTVLDVDDYMEFRNSEFVLRYNAMKVQSREDAQKAFSEENPYETAFAMECKNSGKVIGMVFIQPDSLRWGIASKEISYYLSESYSRQGYMKEALGAVMEWLFETEGLECIGARAFEPNTASRKLLASLGFQQNGVIPRCVKGYGDFVFDDVLYSCFRK